MSYVFIDAYGVGHRGSTQPLVKDEIPKLPIGTINNLNKYNQKGENMSKSYGTTDVNKCKDVVKDVKFFGEGDVFKLISKASSENEKWMKSTKAMEINNVGCVIQVTTQQGDNVAEALTFVPGVKIKETKNINGDVFMREIVAMNSNAAQLY